jgi:hypothetical protein
LFEGYSLGGSQAVLNVDANRTNHVNSTETIDHQSMEEIKICGRFTNPITNEAGIPTSDRLMIDRSRKRISQRCVFRFGQLNNSLRPKYPVRRRPIVNNVKPTKNWLSFPIVGVKGLPEALSQTECSDDSIRMKFVCEV